MEALTIGQIRDLIRHGSDDRDLVCDVIDEHIFKFYDAYCMNDFNLELRASEWGKLKKDIRGLIWALVKSYDIPSLVLQAVRMHEFAKTLEFSGMRREGDRLFGFLSRGDVHVGICITDLESDPTKTLMEGGLGNPNALESMIECKVEQACIGMQNYESGVKRG